MQSGMPRASLVLAVSLVSLGLAAPPAAWGASRYVSSSGTDSGSCASPGAPCRSFGYAYRQASAGDVVELAAGSYGAQSIPSVAGRSAPAVELRASGGTVTVADLDINGDHVLVRGVRSSNEVSVTNARSVAVIDTHAFRVWMQNAHDVLFRGGSYGGNTNTPTVQIAGDPASSALTFDAVDFHDAVATNSTVHMECIWVAGVDGFTVRNSIFRNCAYFDIFFTRLNGPDPKNVLLENNVFEVTKQWNGQNAPYAVNVANWLSQAQNFHFRNNSFGGDIAIQPTTIANMRLSGNIGAVASCKSGVVYSHNVFTNAKCSATDKQVAAAMSQFADPAAHDWRLRSGAAAIDSADPADSPPTDRGGLGRNGPPDAGAHEYGGGGGPPPDGEAPSVPGSPSAVGGIEQVALSWAAASDNVAVTRYNVHRSTTSGFTPSAANRVAQVAGTGFTNTGLAPATYYYKLTAEDAAGNLSAPSAQASAAATPEQTPPTVSLSAPAAGATLAGAVTVAASASDNRGVTGVRFRLDGANLGAEDTSAPYSVPWDTVTASEGSHSLTAVARDAAGNTATSAARSVTVDNEAEPDTQPPGAPGALSATGGAQEVTLGWSAAADDVGVVRYHVHRGLLPGIVPAPANEVAQVEGLSHVDSSLVPGLYHYRVTAEDAAANRGAASEEVAAGASAGPDPDPDSDPGPPEPSGGTRSQRTPAGAQRPTLTLLSARPRTRLRLRASVHGRLHVALRRLRAGGRALVVERASKRAHAGVNVVRAGARLPRGRYRLTVRLVDAQGRSSRPVRVRFRLDGPQDAGAPRRNATRSR